MESARPAGASISGNDDQYDVAGMRFPASKESVK